MQYTPLKIRTVKSDKQLNFDLYIFFKEQYLCYLKTGSIVAIDLLKKLKKQRVAKFYIPADQENLYQEYLDQILNDVMDDPNADVEDKLDVAEEHAGQAVNDLNKNPASEKSYVRTQNAAKSIGKLILDNPDSLKLILGAGHGDKDQLVKHGFNVCALAIRMGRLSKIGGVELEDLATAALIHDIGVANLGKNGKDLFMLEKSALSAEQKALYYKHTFNVGQVLKEKPYVNSQVTQLIEAHEEDLSGSGPLKKKKLTLAEEILSLSNSFDKYCMLNKQLPQAAFKMFQIDFMGKYDLEKITLLKNVLVKGGLL
jgi:HD-GYP domain-containing protein (c-di-GMP phosphodiesterase class II)